MSDLWHKLFSSKISMLVLFVFILIIGAATFIEEIYDTPTVKLLVYHAKWFEFLMLLLVALFIGNNVHKELFCKEKIPHLIFHFSFFALIIGGGITRYFGFEANMHIVENESVNKIYTLEPFFQLKLSDNSIEYTSEHPLYFSQITKSNFHLSFDVPKGNIMIKYKDYHFEAHDLFLQNANKEVIKDYYERNSKDDSPDALIVEILYKNKTYDALLFYDKTKYIQPFKQFKFDDLTMELTYGPKPIELPFHLKLEKFTLSKYPGTNIPSASESYVTLIDSRNSYKKNHVIAKNQVLDYDGYRFFQTSYDEDENGTILSLNYDYYGTRVTYFGYFLMFLGSVLIMFSKKSRFSQLNNKIKMVRAKRKSLVLTIIMLSATSVFSQSNQHIQNPINKEHAHRFGQLLVQTYDGRFSSVHSLAVDVIHKVSGKDHFEVEGKGRMDEMQVFVDMLVDPDFWKTQKTIIIREKSLRNVLGVSGKHASFYDFFNKNNQYKLEEYSKIAFQKKASEQSTFDREVIKVSERVNIFFWTINGTLLKLFPVQNSSNNLWVSWNDSLAYIPITGNLTSLNDDLKLPEFNYSFLMRSYLISTLHARTSNDYTTSDKLLGHIGIIQRQLTPHELLPSAKKVDLEIFYNESKIFDSLKYVYALLGLVLLTLTFIKDFKSSSGKILQTAINIGLVLFGLAFLYQTFGMGLRWYLGGHAPWSNGYEVILLVSWGTIIAGFSVINFSKITLASTAILASILLMVAGHSYYDPQLTNLNPVLKSYWLIIHVAVTTIGYGFLSLSFIMGIVNIFLILVKSANKAETYALSIEELTYINEKLVTIGLFFVSAGTFLGCIWANESWGTYWSWNAKQVWSLIIILVYGVVLHLKYIPKMQSHLTFNIASILSFSSVIMTFVGVNYYFTKGLHSYASDDPPVFPIGVWLAISALLLLITITFVKDRYSRQ